MAIETTGSGNLTLKTRLLDLLLARAPDEDIAAYAQADLERAADLAEKAVASHGKGESLVRIETQSGIVRQGRPVTVITIINDNMPFLFDSIIGEINEVVGEAWFVTHPVLNVQYAQSGEIEVLDEVGGAENGEGKNRLSLIQVHVGRLSDEEAATLEHRLVRILGQVRSAVQDWKPMLARLDQAIVGFSRLPGGLSQDAAAEAVAFLEWLRDDNFTFLGMREYTYSGSKEQGELELADTAGLGILTDPDVLVLRRGTESVTTTPEIRAFLHGPEPLIVTKANAKSFVHRRIYLDYVGIKTYRPDGSLAGELRIVGLFTSAAYTRSVMTVPYLRSKVEAVIEKSGFDPHDHAGKALLNVLENYPRDELFQISVPLLQKYSGVVLALMDRPRVRALVRVDQFDRFVSVIVFVPRDRYDADSRQKIGDYLAGVFDGRLSAYYPAFPEGGLARIHFIIGRSDSKTPVVETAEIEAQVRAIVRSWEDALREAAGPQGIDAQIAEIAARFPQSYRNSFSAQTAIADAERIVQLSANNPIVIDYYRDNLQTLQQTSLRIYHYGSPVALSQRVPILENLGFRVISERTFEVKDENSDNIFLHDMELENAYGGAVDLADGGALFDDAFLSVWHGEMDNDGYNALVQTAGLSASEILVLRAYGRYLQQAGIPQSQDFIAAALNRYPEIARNLYALFGARFDPALRQDEAVQARLDADIRSGLEAVPNIDDDTIIRRYLNLIEATLRTNHFVEGKRENGYSLAFKLDPRAIEGLPEPRPWREIFVYGSQVEGVHLRFGPVARGGLRLSDRAQDYRTEVLGLVKAQQVKNAVIVPVGAKGGFYPKRLPIGGSREEVFEAGRAAYVNFVSSMLLITDNIGAEGMIAPQNVVRHDNDDPYFVVAADKGTATFSDTANAISEAHDFWLDDAFASGGSAGYDHKGMAITARGAWEAVKRHFREMDRDIQTTPFTCVGVGDMSGDVFGNGMLRSTQTRLIAAFDHRDIFIDPDPDAASAFVERQRLFKVPRSSWQDYDQSKLSAGGMIVSRSQKSITLTPKAASAIGIEKLVATPVEVMRAILAAPVDLLWFGGIGTYLKGADEANQEVGDRANDAIRINGGEVRATVIGEGANLGMTQRGRIEYGLRGGRSNSDAIDNSGGVNCSDLEVNIKIALADAMRKGVLKRPDRNILLAGMTDDVAALVLANNYQQTLALSLGYRGGLARMTHQARFMAGLESRGLLDRAVENLPSATVLAERKARGEPLTRPELAVLMAYAKIVLFTDVIATDAPDHPHFEQDLMSYFPKAMVEKFGEEIRSHRLRREIITRVLVNDLVNRGGPTFASQLMENTGCNAGDIFLTFALIREGFELPVLYAEIDALDNRISGEVQLGLYQALSALIHANSAWYLKEAANGDLSGDLDERIASLKLARTELEPRLPELLPAVMRERVALVQKNWIAQGVPEKLASRLALAQFADLVPEIALTARLTGADMVSAARAFFAASEMLRIARIEEAASAIAPSDYYDQLALSRAIAAIDGALQGVTVAALTEHASEKEPVLAWLEAGGARVAAIRERLQQLTEGDDISVSRLSVAAGLMSDLSESRPG
ncbi:NAD-glutamate dehydrogenase [Aquamicrobium segne]|uniref:NAD-glutamate dehydrogenase n=1 Tax=Aquamicrobium segne TaxID=469547 RepID=A0ABW0H0X1_9HYPH